MDNERPNNPAEDFGNLIKEDLPVCFPEWFSIVKKELCHCTTRNGLKGIFKSGKILPNDGRFPDSFPKSQNSYGRINNLISLFDFKSATDQECEIGLGDWYGSYFVNSKKRKKEPVSISILLSRKMLASKLISYKKAWADIRSKKIWVQPIPYVEAYYPEPIPCDAITGYLLICAVSGSLYDYIQHKGPFPGIFDKIDGFVEKHKKAYQEYEQLPERALEKAFNKSKSD
jgi:hypothetical protein